jgi:pimeloyl-ACP methyl ester carboxylesterase
MSRRSAGALDLWVEHGGEGADLLVLCHGMSGTGAVWDGLRRHLEASWPGRWIVPDLRGHGRSDHAPGYGIAQHAGDVAVLVQDALSRQSGRVVICGHSMGGLAAMVLASGWYGVEVADVIAVGVKISWTDDELAQAARLAQAPARRFETRDQAIERYLRVSGLAGLVDPDSRLAASGVVEDDGGWRLAADNRTALVVGPDTTEIHRLACDHANVVLAAGEGDWMVPGDELRALSADAVVLGGLGHNAHVEEPARIWSLIARTVGL